MIRLSRWKWVSIQASAKLLKRANIWQFFSKFFPADSSYRPRYGSCINQALNKSWTSYLEVIQKLRNAWRGPIRNQIITVDFPPKNSTENVLNIHIKSNFIFLRLQTSPFKISNLFPTHFVTFKKAINNDIMRWLLLLITFYHKYEKWSANPIKQIMNLIFTILWNDSEHKWFFHMQISTWKI